MNKNFFVTILILLIFAPVVFGQNVTLTTTCLGPGTIKATSGNGSIQLINCDSVICYDSKCERIVPSGSEITVNATAVPGGHFNSWSQSTGSASLCNGSQGPCIFTITQDSKAAAFFDNPKLDVQVNVQGGGNVTVKFSSGATFIPTCLPPSVPVRWISGPNWFSFRKRIPGSVFRDGPVELARPQPVPEFHPAPYSSIRIQRSPQSLRPQQRFNLIK